MVKNFYIFRHGQSSYNLEGRIQGHTNNSVLTNQGIDEAHNAASLLQDKKIEIVVSSPLRRAKQTGSIVSKMIKVPLQYDDRFTEVNVGIAEGLHYTKAQQKFGDLYRQWRSADPKYIDIHFENGESKRDVQKRIFKALNEYAQNPDYQNIAVSGHGITLSQTLMALNVEQPDIRLSQLIKNPRLRPGIFYYCNSKKLLSTPHNGQTQSSGKSSNGISPS